MDDLCRLFPEAGFQVRSDGGKEFNNSDVKLDFQRCVKNQYQITYFF